MAASQNVVLPRTQTRIAIVGHVDHGKSTLVGRLLHDIGALPDGKMEAVQEMCNRRGMPFEWAFVTDALQAERDQGITIDASHIFFSSAENDFVLIDAPGHREFIKNMISGSSDCDAALVMIDAAEGVKEQSRRHGFLLHLLGIRQIAVAVTKMDLVDFDAARFAEIEQEFTSCLADFGIAAPVVIPVSGRGGDNIVERSENMGWYRGPTVLEAFNALSPAQPADTLPLRMPLQDVYRFDSRRILAGRIETGTLSVGDTIIFSPSNLTGVIKTIEGWATDTPILKASAGESVGITLEDQIFVERGQIISHQENPPTETNVFRARLFWLGDRPLTTGKKYTVRSNTTEITGEVVEIERVIDAAEMQKTGATEVLKDCVADLVIRCDAMLAVDSADENAATGRIVLSDGYDVVGGGLVDMAGYPDQRQIITRKATNITAVEHRVTTPMRIDANGHKGGVIWMTGLSGAGKSTLAVELERALFAAGYQVFVLDGDNLRHGLNANLGFSPEDRSENIRRAGEVAALFASAGFIVVTAFISPYREDRERARKSAGSDFYEVYVKANLEVCETRDPKGLYRRARSGDIENFTGISAPYEVPDKCDFVIDTSARSIEESVDELLSFVSKEFPLTR